MKTTKTPAKSSGARRLPARNGRGWLYMATLGALFLGGIVASWYGSDFLAKYLVRQHMTENSDLFQRRISSILQDVDATFRKRKVEDEEAVALGAYVKASHAYRINFIDDAGLTFWSTKPQEMGKKVEDDHYRTVVAIGRTYSTAPEQERHGGRRMVERPAERPRIDVQRAICDANLCARRRQ